MDVAIVAGTVGVKTDVGAGRLSGSTAAGFAKTPRRYTQRRQGVIRKDAKALYAKTPRRYTQRRQGVTRKDAKALHAKTPRRYTQRRQDRKAARRVGHVPFSAPFPSESLRPLHPSRLCVKNLRVCACFVPFISGPPPRCIQGSGGGSRCCTARHSAHRWPATDRASHVRESRRAATR